MATIKGLKRRVRQWKPKVESAFVVFVEPQPSPVPVENIDLDFEIVEVKSPDDPILPKICSSRRQLSIAKKAIAEGRWDVIVALDPDGEPAGRIWETFASERDLANGVPRMRLAGDEFLMFDLFVEKKHRRSGIAHTMADHFFHKYPPGATSMKYGYGFVSYQNVPSILWHHSIGFKVVQTMNYLAIGPFIKWKLPFSEMPRFGPMSRHGRHTNPEKETFGWPIFP
jgi:hypothetical protein